MRRARRAFFGLVTDRSERGWVEVEGRKKGKDSETEMERKEKGLGPGRAGVTASRVLDADELHRNQQGCADPFPFFSKSSPIFCFQFAYKRDRIRQRLTGGGSSGVPGKGTGERAKIRGEGLFFDSFIFSAVGFARHTTANLRLDSFISSFYLIFQSDTISESYRVLLHWIW